MATATVERKERKVYGPQSALEEWKTQPTLAADSNGQIKRKESAEMTKAAVQHNASALKSKSLTEKGSVKSVKLLRREENREVHRPEPPRHAGQNEEAQRPTIDNGGKVALRSQGGRRRKTHRGARQKEPPRSCRRLHRVPEEGKLFYPDPKKTDVQGGELQDQIAASELDACLKPLLQDRYVSALDYYTASSLSEDSATAAEFLRRMEGLARKNKWILFPMIECSHWITAIVSCNADGSTNTVVYDSAPHPVVHSAIQEFYNRAGGEFAKNIPPVICHARQVRGSNECGLHVMFIALLKHLGQPLPRPTMPTPVLDLKRWRSILQEAQCNITPEVTMRLTACVGDVYFPDQIKGGAEAREVEWNDGIFSIPITEETQALQKGSLTGQPLDEERAMQEQIDQTPVPWDLLLSLRLNAVDRDHLVWWKEDMEKSHGLEAPAAKTARLGWAPPALASNGGFMAKARRAVQSTLGSVRLHGPEPSSASKFNYWYDGTQITDTLVDHVTAQLPRAADEAGIPFEWSIIPSSQFSSFAQWGIDSGIPNLGPKVACVVHHPRLEHFTTFTFDGTAVAPQLNVYDSLFRTRMQSVRYETQRLIGRFINLLRRRGVNPPRFAVMRGCPRQAINDCGLQAVNNLIRVTTGKIGLFSREQIRLAFIHHSRNDGHDFRFSLFAREPHPPEPTSPSPGARQEEPSASTHEPLPLYPVAAPTDDTMLKPRRALKHAEVRVSAGNMGLGSAIIVQSRARGKDATRYAAVIVETPVKRNPGSKGGLSVTHSFCESCKNWHEDARFEEFPAQHTDYFEFRLEGRDEVRPNVTESCRELDEFDDEDDEEAFYEKPAELETDDSGTTSFENNLEKLLHESKAPTRDLPTSSPSQIQAAIVLKWFIYENRPANHVHAIVWNRLAPSTRKQHRRRLKELQDFVRISNNKDAPLSRVVVQMVMKRATERKWAWSTISSALSSINSALRNLECYTNHLPSVALDEDRYFSQALAHAQKLARLGAVKPKGSAPLSITNYEKLSDQLKGKMGWALLQLTWYLAGRIGDVRRLKKEELTIDLQSIDESGYCPVQARFTEGKGVSFCGPFTIKTRIPLAKAKAIMEAIRDRRPQQYVFDVPIQRQVALAIGALPDHSVRSIRRGALVHLANCGVKDDHLQLLSGHKRRDTLLRYLNWGGASSEAALAAKERAKLLHQADPRGGMEQRDAHPMWMGYYSGFNGQPNGRRSKPSRSIFNMKPANDLELGNRKEKIDTSAWPLHAKMNLGTVDCEKLVALTVSDDLREALRKAFSWLHSASDYGVAWSPIEPERIPFSSFTPEHMRTMLEADKVVPLPEGAEIRCAVKGFPTPQLNKERLRPVFECLFNKAINREALPPLSYPSRRERQAAIAKMRFRIEFDFSAWYDQFKLDESVQPYYALRVKEPVEVNGQMYDKFMLTRLPMGGSHAAHVAQTATWAIIEPIIKMTGVETITMIDNVCFASNDEAAFVQAVECFLQRCELVGATLNDQDTLPRTHDEIAASGLKGSKESFVFLGEEFNGEKVRNTQKNLEKLRTAWLRVKSALRDRSQIVTRRHLAAIIGLVVWMSVTTDIGMYHHFELFRTLSRVETMPGSWDTPVEISPAIVGHFAPIVQILLENRGVGVNLAPTPSLNHQDYDASFVVDASATGFGGYALVRVQGEDGPVSKVLRFNHGFSKLMRHSAWAEPFGATAVLKWIRDNYNARNVAIITDHNAMPLKQRIPLSGHSGFSKAYYLNRFFNELYENGGGQIFFVAGKVNIGDAPSRETMIGQGWNVHDVTETQVFPSLSDFNHPHLPMKKRTWWNV